MNFVKLSGVIGKNIYFQQQEQGRAYISFILSVEDNWKVNQNTKKNLTYFIHCVAYSKIAIGLNEQIEEGKKLTITKGQLFNQKIQEEWKTSVQVEEFIFKG